MSQDIMIQVNFLFHSFLMGIGITIVYDGFLILRRLIAHNLLMISLEDMLFWIGCAIGVFYMLYEENNGILRWFAVFGAAVGMVVYKISISQIIIDVMSTIFRWIGSLLLSVLRVFCRPLRFLGKKIRSFFRVSARKSRKAGKYVKNRLTGAWKLFRITLCKR